MKVIIWLKETSQPVEHTKVTNAYQKGAFFCVFIESENEVYKYPIANIWRVMESYRP